MNEGRVFLSYDEAVELLPDTDYIHTFRGRVPFMIGADWKRDDLLEAIQKYQPELSGDFATSMGHGIVFKDHHGWVFVETKEDDKNEQN